MLIAIRIVYGLFICVLLEVQIYILFKEISVMKYQQEFFQKIAYEYQQNKLHWEMDQLDSWKVDGKAILNLFKYSGWFECRIGGCYTKTFCTLHKAIYFRRLSFKI